MRREDEVIRVDGYENREDGSEMGSMDVQVESLKVWEQVRREGREEEIGELKEVEGREGGIDGVEGRGGSCCC